MICITELAAGLATAAAVTVAATRNRRTTLVLVNSRIRYFPRDPGGGRLRRSLWPGAAPKMQVENLRRCLVFAMLSCVTFAFNSIDQQDGGWILSWNERFPSCSSADLNLAVSQPCDGSKLWIDSNAVIHRTYPPEGMSLWTDEEQRLLLSVEIDSPNWPEGAIVKFLVDGSFVDCESRTTAFTDFGLGEHTVSAVLYISGGQKTVSCSNSTFIAHRHLEHAFPPTIGFSAEEPWSGQALPLEMADILRWESDAVDFESVEVDDASAFLGRRWRELAFRYTPENETWSAAQMTLRDYSIFHAQALKDIGGVQRSLFLIFRPFPGSGLGNHLLALVCGPTAGPCRSEAPARELTLARRR